MIKVFCDQCKDEITKGRELNGGQSGTRLATSVGHLGVEILTSQNGASNAGHYCKYCVLDAVYALDDRPRVMST